MLGNLHVQLGILKVALNVRFQTVMADFNFSTIIEAVEVVTASNP